MSKTTEKQTFGFQAEVKQLLQLMIHSLYSNKEIFLRELISNASDAADKLRFEALNHPALLEEDTDLKIWVNFDKTARTITIRDNGIGMNTDEVISHLGTIAKSGTKEFLQNLSGDKAHDTQLIGQFGVGFYSSFIVADEVTVTTRKAGDPSEAGVRWRSKGEGNYDIESIDVPQRGTEVVLHLKADENEFLDDWQLRSIIKKYSDHISLPVVMKKVASPVLDSQEAEPTPASEPVDEVVNRASALWTQPKNEISVEQYQEFYKHIAHDYEPPISWLHFKVEGKLEYTSILYIPSKAPFDLYQVNKPRGLKLYVQRVFIMDDAEQFLPHYLRFVRGILDSNDLPLNVSREILQNHRIIDQLKSAITKRVLSQLDQLSEQEPEKFATVWKEFGPVLKEGPAEDPGNQEQVAKLLRFASTHSDNEQQTVSLADYVSRMKPNQSKIYYLAADSFNAAKNSPHLEIFRKKGVEVLLMSERIDEWLMSHLTKFADKQLQSVARGGLDLKELGEDEDTSNIDAQKTEFEDTLKKAEKILGDHVKAVRLSSRLTQSPACIVADEHAMTSQMERILKSAGQAIPKQKPILELNPEHSMVKRLKHETDATRFEDWIHILLDQSILAEGGQLEDPAQFVKRFNLLLLELPEG